MADEFSQAVSFVNSYFALVDGLASDLEDHLAEDVVLDWFGQTIKGRKDVASFMKFQKIKSRHVFNDITPKNTIGYRENRSLRRKYHSAGGVLDNNNPLEDTECQSKYKRKCYSEEFSQNLDESILFDSSLCDTNSSLDTTSELSQSEIHPEITDNIIEKELKLHALHLDSFSTPQVPFRPQSDDFEVTTTPDIDMPLNLKPTNMVEMEMNIEDLKAKELMKNEIGQGDSKKSSLKFLEASGVIEFCRVFNAQQIRKDTRKRHCKLQIAYSIKDVNSNSHSEVLAGNAQMKFKDDYEEERNQFLEGLHLQMNKDRGNINNLLTPKYVRGQLKFDKAGKCENIDGAGDKEFIFNYKIHVIIYESNTKCRLNLSHEFDGEEYAEDADQ